MKTQYVQAFLKTLAAGTTIDAALSGLRAVLKSRKHEKLLTSILLETLRILEAQSGAQEAIVKTVSRAEATTLAAEIKVVLAQLGVSKGTTVNYQVDETLVGGFVATFDYKEHDQSYKKSLHTLYESIVK
ncbi:MAG: F0F1 ATP synthase subunit delta [Patescibacteria group bacterium]